MGAALERPLAYQIQLHNVFSMRCALRIEKVHRKLVNPFHNKLKVVRDNLRLSNTIQFTYRSP